MMLFVKWLFYGWIIILLVASIVIVYTDLRWFWIPDEAVAAIAVANGTACLCQLTRPDGLVSIIAIISILLLYHFFPIGMGSGDVKLMAALVPGCSAFMFYDTIVVAFVTGSIIALGYWIVFRKRVIPFGPFLILGWWMSFLMGGTHESWILNFI